MATGKIKFDGRISMVTQTNPAQPEIMLSSLESNKPILGLWMQIVAEMSLEVNL